MEIKSMEKSFDNRARLADAVTDDLINQIDHGYDYNQIDEDFEILKWLWEYELREKMLAAGLDECPVFREGMRADGGEDKQDEDEAALKKEALEAFTALKKSAAALEKAVKAKDEKQQ